MEQFNEKLKQVHTGFHQYMDLDFFKEIVKLFDWTNEPEILEELPDGIWLKFPGGYDFFYSESFMDGEISVRFKDVTSNKLNDIFGLIHNLSVKSPSGLNFRNEMGSMRREEKVKTRLYNKVHLVHYHFDGRFDSAPRCA